MRLPLFALALLAAPIAHAETGFEAPERTINIDAETAKRLGITLVAAAETDHRTEISGLGQVVGADTLAQTEADLTQAESAVLFSDAAADRARSLFGADKSISREKLEAAEHQSAVDHAALTLARRKASAAWGRNAPWHDSKQLAALVTKISAGQAALIHATFPANTAGSALPASVQVQRIGADEESKGWAAATIWSAPADPSFPGRSFFLLLEGADLPAQGERVRIGAKIGQAEHGALVPADAIVIAEGRTWLYVQESPGYFVRQAVAIAAPDGAGYFTSEAVQPGEMIVVHGAAHLLARETGAAD